MPSFSIHRLLHASVIVADYRHSLTFYRDLLGFEVDNSRPDLGYPGVWLTIGSQQIHLLELPNPDPSHDRPEHGGRDRHIALAITNLTNLKKALDKQRIPFTESKSGRAAIFFRDPDGNALEMIESELI